MSEAFMDMTRRLKHFAGREVVLRLSTKTDERFDGFVEDVGKHWVLLANISSSIVLDGYVALRVDQVVEFQDDEEYAASVFHLEALRLRGQLPLSSAPAIDLRSPEAIIRSALEVAPLVTIYPEEQYPGCYIGREARFSDGRVEFMEIDPEANWTDDDEGYELAGIVRIDFGGQYEDALWQVAQARAAAR
jgi:hypothetical protein